MLQVQVSVGCRFALLSGEVELVDRCRSRVVDFIQARLAPLYTQDAHSSRCTCGPSRNVSRVRGAMHRVPVVAETRDAPMWWGATILQRASFGQHHDQPSPPSLVRVPSRAELPQCILAECTHQRDNCARALERIVPVIWWHGGVRTAQVSFCKPYQLASVEAACGRCSGECTRLAVRPGDQCGSRGRAQIESGFSLLLRRHELDDSSSDSTRQGRACQAMRLWNLRPQA